MELSPPCPLLGLKVGHYLLDQTGSWDDSKWVFYGPNLEPGLAILPKLLGYGKACAQQNGTSHNSRYLMQNPFFGEQISLMLVSGYETWQVLYLLREAEKETCSQAQRGHI